MHFYTESWNATNKNCLFDAKFFEFEEFSIEPFFLGSIQPQHAVPEAVLLGKMAYHTKQIRGECI